MHFNKLSEEQLTHIKHTENVQTTDRVYICLSVSPFHTYADIDTGTHRQCSAPYQPLSVCVCLGAQPISFQRDTA